MGTNRVAIQAVRTYDGSFIWGRNALSVYFDWYLSEPETNVAGNDCVEIKNNVGWNKQSTDIYGYTSPVTLNLFQDVHCQTMYYEQLVCEADFEKQSGTVAFIMPSHWFSGWVSIAPIFGSPDLPTDDDAEVMFGVTIMMNREDCRFGDRMLFNVSWDRFVIEKEQDCTVLVGGYTTYTKYNRMLKNMTWIALDTTRSQLKIGYVYWTNKFIQRMSIDLNTGHVYSTFHTQSFWLTAWGYDKYPATEVCNLVGVGMHIADISSSTEDDAAGTSMYFGAAWIGGKRVNATQTGFKWHTTNNDMFPGYTNFGPGEPRNAWDVDSSPEGCTYKLFMGPWRDGICDFRRNSMVCEKNSWVNSSVVTHFLVNDHVIRFNTSVVKRIGTDPVFNVNFIFSQDNYVQMQADENYAGLTMQIHASQCLGQDLLVDSYSPTGVLAVAKTYWNGACALVLKNTQIFSEWKTHMASTTHTNPYTHRTQLSYSWILWAVVPDFSRSRFHAPAEWTSPENG